MRLIDPSTPCYPPRTIGPIAHGTRPDSLTTDVKYRLLPTRDKIGYISWSLQLPHPIPPCMYKSGTISHCSLSSKGNEREQIKVPITDKTRSYQSVLRWENTQQYDTITRQTHFPHTKQAYWAPTLRQQFKKSSTHTLTLIAVSIRPIQDQEEICSS